MTDLTEPPVRGPEHDRLACFLGDWRAEGVNYDAEGNRTPWLSDEHVEWLPGEFFVVQRWQANPDQPFSGLGVIGYDPQEQRYFTRSFENHGFFRDYAMDVDGEVWTFTGETERARVEFADDGETQRIHWEFKHGEAWLPLCDRVARRVRH
jgi:hypothetical protein